MKKLLLLGLWVLFALPVLAQTKSSLSTSSLTAVTGTVSVSAVVDKQDSVAVYGTYAAWKSIPSGAATTVTALSVVKLALDSLKTYQNLFVNVSGRSRTKITVSANDTLYVPVQNGFLTAQGRANRWQTVPIRRSIKYIRFEFILPTSLFRFNEIVVTK